MFHLRTSTSIYVQFTYLFYFQASSGPGTWYEYQEPGTSCLNQAPSLQTKTHYGSNKVAIGATDASNNIFFVKFRAGHNGIGPMTNSQSDEFHKKYNKSQNRATGPSNNANCIEFDFQPNGINAVPKKIQALPPKAPGR